MHRILFVCHGNICRSPMAEFVMKHLLRQAGVADRFEIASCATSREEIGNSLYPPVKRILDSYGIPWEDRCARQFRVEEYGRYDLILCADEYNLRNLSRMTSDPDGKIHLITHWTGKDEPIPDPWYNDDFEGAFRAVLRSCKALLEHLDFRAPYIYGCATNTLYKVDLIARSYPIQMVNQHERENR